MYQLAPLGVRVTNLDTGELMLVTDQRYVDWLAAGNTPMPAPQPELSELVLAAINRTYADVDSLYSVAVGNRAEEYRQAEAAALAYQAAGYSGAVSEYISSWASTNPPMTNAQSADVIIARASALRSAILDARTQRFVSQAAMRAATTRAELDTAVAAWDAFVTAARTALA